MYATPLKDANGADRLSTQDQGTNLKDKSAALGVSAGPIYFSEDEQLTRHDSHAENDRFVKNLLTKFGAAAGAGTAGNSEAQSGSHHYRTRSTYGD